MDTAFITGATGFIGSHVAQVLLERGWKVRALKRKSSVCPSFGGLQLEWRTGDLRDPDSIRRAMAGCRVVIHVAADYRLWVRRPEELYRSNVDGTVNIMRAALGCRVERVVYTSSVGALGLNRDGTPADENAPVRLEDMIGHYKRSKFLAERRAEEFLQAGLPIVFVHPSTPVGPGDRKPTPTGKIIVDYLNGRMPAYVDTGLNLIHVRDVAEGHLAALERGRVGEKYILGHRNMTLAEIFRSLEAVSRVPAPRFRLPRTPVLWFAYANEALAHVTGIEPLIPLEGIRMAKRLMFFDAGKAVRELGLPQTPIDRTLEEAVAWFKKNGYITRQ